MERTAWPLLGCLRNFQEWDIAPGCILGGEVISQEADLKIIGTVSQVSREKLFFFFFFKHFIYLKRMRDRVHEPGMGQRESEIERESPMKTPC